MSENPFNHTISNRPRVYQSRNFYAQPGGRKPFSEVGWCCQYPYLSYPNNVKQFDTWQEAIDCALAYRPPVMYNFTSGNSTITYNYPSWVNPHKWG